MAILNKDISRARRLVKSGGVIATDIKDEAHRRHRRNQDSILRQIVDGTKSADEDLDFNTKPGSGWDVA
jgi:hypothetical protein